jgi:Mrp family chromosome partitioning ATPase
VGEITEALRQARVPEKAGARTSREPREHDLPPPPLPVARAEPTHAKVSADKRGQWTSREVVVQGRGAAAESIRHVALRLRRELEARDARSVAIVSALRQEGKTTISCNLALALASLSAPRTVALVDLDLRKPSVASNLETPCEVGIDDVLSGRRELADACVAIERPALDVYAVRRPQEAAHEMLCAPAFVPTVRELERRYEVVVFDTPPVLLVPDAVVILDTVKAAVAVARAGISTRRAVEAMCGMLPAGRLVGSVLNEGALPVATSSYGYYGEDAREGV